MDSFYRWAFDRDLYVLLGLEQSASDAQINCQYKRLSRHHHPDRGGSDDTFQLINAARSILMDPIARREYDTYRHQLSAPPPLPPPPRRPPPRPPSPPRSVKYDPVPSNLLDEVSNELYALLHPKRSSEAWMRAIAGTRKQILKDLSKLSSLVAVMEPCLRAFALEIAARRSESFGSIFKDASFKGYDMHKGKVVDYGNVAYKAFLYACSLKSATIHRLLEECSFAFPTLDPLYTDTPDALERQGDIVEVVYGITRGNDFCGLRHLHAITVWRHVFTDMSNCFHAIDYLRRLVLKGGRLKRTGVVLGRLLSLECSRKALDDTSVMLGSIAVVLGDRLMRG